MAKREKVADPKPNLYFTSEKEGLKFVSSGCTILDCALGGGYVLGRITNIVGDKSTAKTALATEALINFLVKYPNGAAAYRDAEAAFDRAYAAAMGLPVAQIDFGETNLTTVEDFERDLTAFIEKQQKAGEPGVYILDSLDALSDEAEMARDVGEATYGGNKAKQLSAMFRKLTGKLEGSQILLIVVSQVRDNIGAMFGEKHKRSGGKALDFYASQILWLAHIKTLDKTIKKVKRAYGVVIRAKVKKNKVGIAFRDCDFMFIFGYGVEDAMASVSWLINVNRTESIGMSEAAARDYLKDLETMDNAEYQKELGTISTTVRKVWKEVEESFLPKRAKYGVE